MSLKAYGKINLGLDVLRRREDGYHDVRMIMQAVGILIRVDLIWKEEPGNSGGNKSVLSSYRKQSGSGSGKLLMDEFQFRRDC